MSRIGFLGPRIEYSIRKTFVDIECSESPQPPSEKRGHSAPATLQNVIVVEDLHFDRHGDTMPEVREKICSSRNLNSLLQHCSADRAFTENSTCFDGEPEVNKQTRSRSEMCYSRIDMESKAHNVEFVGAFPSCCDATLEASDEFVSHTEKSFLSNDVISESQHVGTIRAHSDDSTRHDTTPEASEEAPSRSDMQDEIGHTAKKRKKSQKERRKQRHRQHLAASIVQRGWRCYRARCHLLHLLVLSTVAQWAEAAVRRSEAIYTVQRAWRCHKARCRLCSLLVGSATARICARAETAVLCMWGRAVHMIQRIWRGYSARCRLFSSLAASATARIGARAKAAVMCMRESAAHMIQRLWRGHLARKLRFFLQEICSRLSSGSRGRHHMIFNDSILHVGVNMVQSVTSLVMQAHIFEICRPVVIEALNTCRWCIIERAVLLSHLTINLASANFESAALDCMVEWVATCAIAFPLHAAPPRPNGSAFETVQGPDSDYDPSPPDVHPNGTAQTSGQLIDVGHSQAQTTSVSSLDATSGASSTTQHNAISGHAVIASRKDRPKQCVSASSWAADDFHVSMISSEIHCNNAGYQAYRIREHADLPSCVDPHNCTAVTAIPLHALLLGNDSYKSLARLRGGSKDVRAFGGALGETGFDCKISENLLAVSICLHIEAYLKYTFELLDHLTKLDNRQCMHSYITWFHYSGHGCVIQGRTFLAGIDARRDDLESWVDAEKLLLSRLRVMRTRGVRLICVVSFDTCRTVHPVAGDLVPLPRERQLTQRPDMIILHACDPYADAREGTADGHGHFTASMMEHIGELQYTDFSKLFRNIAQGVRQRSLCQRPWMETRCPVEVRLGRGREFDFPRFGETPFTNANSSSPPIVASDMRFLSDTHSVEVVGEAIRPEQDPRCQLGRRFSRLRSCLLLVRSFHTRLRPCQAIHEE